MKLLDTVAAVSTPRGKGGVAMVRISGSDAFDVADKIFKTKNDTPPSALPHGKMSYGEIFMPLSFEKSIDDGMAVIFKAPRSFTGENTVQLYCHGGALITKQVLSAALSAGARAAEAGEFTRRAFIFGKMSLSSAESLGNLLEAKTETQLRLARGGMRGNFDRKTNEIYETLRSVMSSILAVIDFPDEDLADMSREQICASVQGAVCDIRSLIASYSTGKAVNEGVSTVICGRANAGKSSVYNRILGYDAAIVTDVEGTTRDILREQATLGSVTLLLCDTAGIRQTSDKVESIGIDRALSEIESAELILAVFDGSDALSEDDLALIERLRPMRSHTVALINKSDREQNESTVKVIGESFGKALTVSASSGEGFDSLGRIIDEMFIDGDIDMDNDPIVTGARQYATLQNALSSLEASLEQLTLEMPLDICCIGIEEAMSSLALIDGREINEDIVSEIFSKFCVGK